MAYVISDSCISCGTCAGGCPAGAIAQGDAHYEIDKDACLSCGACAVSYTHLAYCPLQTGVLPEGL